MKENQLKPSLSLGQLAGGVILAVALWLRHDSQTSNLLILQFEGQQAPGTFYISEYSTPRETHHKHKKKFLFSPSHQHSTFHYFIPF